MNTKRTRNWHAIILLLFFLQAFSQGALAQDKLCGEPPPVADESLKGEIKGKAQLLSRFLGQAAISGQIETARKEIFSRYPYGERTDAYFQYQVCVLLMQDKSMSTGQKLEELKKIQREFRRPPPATSGAPVNQSISGSGNVAVGNVGRDVYIGRSEPQPPVTIVEAAKGDAERAREAALRAGASTLQDDWKQAEERYSLGQQVYQKGELNAAREIFSRSVYDFDRLRTMALQAEFTRARVEQATRPKPLQKPIIASSRPSTYIWVQAGNYSDKQGVQIQGTAITGLGDGKWTKYSGINFGAQGSRGFIVQVASLQGGGEIEVHLDSVNGNAITRLGVAPTGSSTTFTYQLGTTPLTTGTHDVYLAYKGDNAGALRAFGFTRTTPGGARDDSSRLHPYRQSLESRAH